MSARLDGRRVLITREAERAAPVAEAVTARGGVPLCFPTIATFPPEDPAPLRAAAARLADWDWVAVSSRTGVAALAVAAREAGATMPAAGRPRYAAVGAGTADALAGQGIASVLVPARQDADGMLAAMRDAGAAGARVLVVRAEAGRDVLVDGLRAAGARVDFVVAYRTATARPPADAVAALRDGPRAYVALFMSPSAFRGWVEILGEAALPWLSGAYAVAIGDVTARAMSAAGRPPDAVATAPTIDAMLDCAARGTAGGDGADGG